MKNLKCALAALALSATTGLNAQITNPAPYCNAQFDNAGMFNVSDAIKNVSFGTLNNNSGGQYADPHYVFYNNLPVASFAKSSTTPMTLTFEVHGGCGYGVWIDFNQNNTFEANEKVAGTTATSWLDLGNNVVVTNNVTIPATALTGNTRMRIRIVEDDDYTMANGGAILACNTGTSAAAIMDWGETEDYTINITGGSTSQAPVASFTVNATSGIANTTLFNFTNTSTNTPTSYVWSFSPNTVAYQNGTSATSANPIVQFTSNGTYSVKMKATNASGADSVEKLNYITITGATSIANTTFTNFEVFPNPSNGTINFSKALTQANIQVTDVTGALRFVQANFSGNALNLNQLNAGMYFVKIIQNDAVFYKKLAISK